MRKKRIGFLFGYIYTWLFACVDYTIVTELRRGVSLNLFLLDLQTGFVDDFGFLSQTKPIFLLLTAIMLVACLYELICCLFRLDEKLWSQKEQNAQTVNPVRKVVGILILFLSGVLIVNSLKWVKPMMAIKPAGDFAGTTYVAHAGGGIDGLAYTNSLEAFEQSYRNGYRTIELDFSVTSDGEMVCWHDWERPVNDEIDGSYVPTAQEFLDAKIEGKYTPMSLADVFELMKKYEDVYIITDTKNDVWADIIDDFRLIQRTAVETNSTAMYDRMVVQLYNYDMFDAVESVQHFPNYILTLYQLEGYSGVDFRRHCRFCYDHHVRGITMPKKYVSKRNVEDAKRYKIDVYVHTVNDPAEVENDAEFGVRGFYTDFILP